MPISLIPPIFNHILNLFILLMFTNAFEVHISYLVCIYLLQIDIYGFLIMLLAIIIDEFLLIIHLRLNHQKIKYLCFISL
jgi:hypothetical protein